MDFTEIINALLALLAAVITGFIIPWLKTKLNTEQAQNIKIWTEMAVKAAEQYYGSGLGEQKKEFVMNWLDEKGVVVDEAAVEAAVWECINKIKWENTNPVLNEVEKEAQGIPVELEQGVG